MTQLASFIDGFTSASAPVVSGGSQEDYVIANNQSSASTLFTIDSAVYKSAFISFELERSETGNEYRQAGHIVLHYDGTNWVYNLGNWQGDDMVVTTLSNGYDVKLEITTLTGVGSFKYSSGNMTAGAYDGNLRLFITRIATA